jgi:hypothetical protein
MAIYILAALVLAYALVMWWFLWRPHQTSSCSHSKTDVPFNELLSLSSATINGSAAHPIAIVPGPNPAPPRRLP